MKRRRTKKQKAEAVRRFRNGETAVSICRDLGVSTGSLYIWNKGATDVPATVAVDALEVRRLEEENRKLKCLIADLVIGNGLLTAGR